MMEHLNMQSMDKVAANVAKIRELFPNCVTERINNEGQLEHAIDFDMLKQELSDHVVDGLQERYQFTWPDKRKAILAANAPINKTLRPCREESVDFDNTENLYIEGDNLEVLKLLQETYLGKVKMIYIDPPYNTGNDFVYEDEFKQSADEYIDNSGQLDEEGNRLVANTESNGRFHTDWLNMMYPRLNLAKDLLSEDGVIAISIDENEVENLKRCCKEIYGESNYIATIISKMNPRGSQSSKDIAITHEYILVIAKSKEYQVNGLELTEEQEKEYKYQDAMGCYRLLGLRKRGADSRREDSPSMYFPIYYDPDNDNLSTIEKYSVIIYPKLSDGTDGRWRWSKSKVEREKNLLVVRAVKRGTEYEYDVFSKDYLSENKRRKPMSIWDDKEINNEFATELLTDLFKEKKIFDYSKSLFLLKKLITVLSSADSLVLDFFSGSATTAHAVMQLNAEDGGKRKFIMVQLQEECVENSEAYKAGYKNICEIGKERIRRAGKKIKEENPLTTQDLDIGFRVLKCDSSNMEDVYFTPKEYMDKQQSLFIDNIKKDRSDEDLLFDAMLKLDTPLSSKIEKISIAGKTVYNVAQGHLMACFDTDVTDEVITAIAKEMPSYFVMRDSSQADDSVAINFEQIFNTYSPQTVRRVL
ncbi:site-specific DNA-methyltransferase [Phascolarctobacterium succinatutens]|uniref:site-specific DNA-methyltransferase n=1 Tax=Phascolarctobacterium succinatutens TaxID=626940 RepID=UPI0023F72A02|nr:site-specific DNA-methyltransferase [Phascolarctobacterium succinatutens]